MHFAGLVTALLAGAAAVASTALPADASAHYLEARANGATCGTVSYSASAITAASDRACKYYKDKTPANDYPHTFNNREGFVFATSGPYIEFPIMKTGVLYSGGAPGPDRVVVNRNSCAQAGVMTHTGASGNAFVMCKVQQSTTTPSSDGVRSVFGLPSLGQSSTCAAVALLVAAVW